MRIMVNRHCELERKTGIGNYSNQVVDAMHRLNSPMTVESFPQGWVKEIESYRARTRISKLSRSDPRSTLNGTSTESSPSPRFLTDRLLRLGKSLHRSWSPEPFCDKSLHRHFRSLSSKCDLYHEPNCIPWESGMPTITTLPDLSVVLHPEWHPTARIEFYEEHFERGMKQCQRILTTSDFSRRQIVEELGFPAALVTRTYCGVNPDLRPLPAEAVRQRKQEMGLPEDYLLYVGTLEPRKNLLMLLKAYCSLPANVRDHCQLVLVGGWGWNTQELAAFLEDQARSRGVMHLGYVPDEQLITLYNGARALLFPSFYEGFGLPPLEMMACGGAVLVSTAEALVETTGGHGHTIDPHDDDGWRSAMLRIIQDDEWRDHLRQGVVAWAKRFTWERCAEETLEAYRLCLDAPSTPTPLRSVIDRLGEP